MTEIFCFGSIDLTDIFGVTSPEQVKEELRPYLYHSPKDHYFLNVSLKNKKRASDWGHTHIIEASTKGEKKTVKLCELKEFLREGKPQAAPQQQAQSPAQGGRYDGGYTPAPNYDDINF